MAGILNRALSQAGLGELLQRLLRGEAADPAQVDRLRSADVLLLAGLADAVRTHFHGDEVRVCSAQAAARELELVRVGAASAGGAAEDRTGQELLVEVALARIATPGKVGVAVGIEAFGLQLAQVALTFGANVLFGEFGSARGLILLDGPSARRAELGGLIERAGRRVRFDEPRPMVSLESRS